MRTNALAARRLARLALLPLALLGPGCGKPLLYGEVEIPDLQVTVPQQAFSSTVSPNPLDLCPPEVVLTGTQTCLQKSVTLGLGKDFVDATKNATYELRLTQLGIVLTTTPALGDFGDVVDVRVAVAQTGTLPAVDLATYTRADPLAKPTTITVGAMSNVDLAPYVQAGEVALYARMIFDQNMPAFNADLLGDFYLRVTVDYGKQAGLY
jgi:hypothetical protein